MAAERHEIEAGELLGHESWMRRVAWKVLGEGSDVDDIVQEAWLAHLERPAVVDAEHARARLGAIVRNRAVSLLRRRRRRREAEDARRELAARTEVEQTLAKVELYQSMLRWILELEAPYRDILLLRYSKGLEPIVIARRLDLPPSTVRVRLKRGLALLRARFDREHGEKDRLAFGLILFGVEFGPRRAPWTLMMAGTAVVLMVAVSLVVHLGNFGSDPRAESLASLENSIGATTAEPRRGAAAAVVTSETDSTAVESSEGAALLRGCIRLLPEEFRGSTILVYPEPYLTGDDLETPLLQPQPHDALAALDESRVVRVRAGDDYRIPVPAAGRYQMRLVLPDVPGALQVWTGTDRPTTLDLEVLPRLDVGFAGPQLPNSLELRYPTSSGEARRPVAMTEGRASLEGPFMPGLMLAIGHPGDDSLWTTRVLESPMELRLPPIEAERHCHLRAGERAALGAAAWRSSVSGFSPRVTQVVWFDHGYGYQIERPVVDGEFRYRIPVGCNLERSHLRVEAEGHGTRTLPLDRAPEIVELEPLRVYEALVRDEQDRPLDDLDVIIADENGPRWRGRTDEQGRFEAREMSQFAPFRLEPTRSLTLFLRGGVPPTRCRIHLDDGLLPAVVLATSSSRTRLRIQDREGDVVVSARARIVPCLEEPGLNLLEKSEFVADAEGEIELPAFVGGPWLIAVDAPGYASAALLLDAGKTDPAPVVMEPLEVRTEAALSFRFVDEAGDAVPNVRIELDMPQHDRPLSTLSDARGEVRFRHLEANQDFAFTVLKEGRVPSLSTPARHRGSNGSLSVLMLRQRPLALVEPGSWSEGRVFVRADEESREMRRLRLEADGQAWLGCEPQLIEVVVPGHHPCGMSWDGSSELTPRALAPGPSLVLEDAATEPWIVTALEIFGLDPGVTIATSDLAQFGVTLDPDRRSVQLTPGRYRVATRNAAGDPLEIVVDLERDQSLGFSESGNFEIR